MTKLDEIEPLIGLGELRFGDLRSDVVAKLGEPELKNEFQSGQEYPDNAGDTISYEVNLSVLKWQNGIECIFANERLGNIFAKRSSATIAGVQIIGASMTEVVGTIGSNFGASKLDEDISEKTNGLYTSSVDYSDAGLTLWAKDDSIIAVAVRANSFDEKGRPIPVDT